MLANGSLISGVIAVEGEYFKILLPKGKLQVRVDQVDFLCQSREEAYVRRRARKITTTATADAHLEMARWCVQHELLAYAEAEIAAARAIEPQHRLLANAETQLAQAHKISDRVEGAVAIIKDPMVVHAAATAESSGRAFGDIPPWARTEFIKRVQPMLAQSCATAGCHLPNTAHELQIDRAALDGVGNPDLIHRNLASAIAMLDLADPEASPLLTKGATPHGAEAKRSRPLTPHQLEILRAWVTQLALNEAPREEVEEPVGTQIVVGMNGGPQQKYVLGVPAAATDPFDPAEFNQAQAAAKTSAEANAILPAEESPSEPSQ